MWFLSGPCGHKCNADATCYKFRVTVATDITVMSTSLSALNDITVILGQSSCLISGSWFSSPRLWFCCCAGVVRWARGPHHPPVRRPQAGHLRRILRGDPSSEEPRGQDARGAEQSRPDQHAAADEGLRRTDVVFGKNHQHAWGQWAFMFFSNGIERGFDSKF